MSANTETTGADRTGCKAWCGTYAKHSPTYNRFWDSRLRCSGDHAPVHWCSHDCREQRLPPIAAPAAHVDATPEPAKSCVCPHGPSTTNGKCPVHVTAGIPVSGFADCACVKCAPPAQEAPKQWKEHARCGFPIVSSNREAAVTAVGKHQATCEKCSAQEAPKAAPVLEWSFTDQEGREHRFATGDERDAASRAYWSWMAEQAGKPYAGPERLPRPQLAADWVEDCLPEGGR